MHKAPDRVDTDTASLAPRPAPDAPAVVPATLVVGFRGEGKVQLIGALLRMRPSEQRWTLLGPGQAPPAAVTSDFQSLPALCMCCTGLLPFRTGLTRLLRHGKTAPPARLIIDAGAEGHACRTRAELGSHRFIDAVKLTSTIAMIDTDLKGIDKAHAKVAIDDLADAADIIIVWSAGALGGHATPAMRSVAERIGRAAQPWFAGGDTIDAAARAALGKGTS